MRPGRNRSEKPTVELRVRKETIKHLRSLSEDELLAVGGAEKQPPPPKPSCATC